MNIYLFCKIQALYEFLSNKNLAKFKISFSSSDSLKKVINKMSLIESINKYSKPSYKAPRPWNNLLYSADKLLELSITICLIWMGS